MTDESVLERKFEIVNKLGLHARPAAQLVKTAQKFTAEVEVAKDGISVNGKSIMGILMLAAGKGTTITVRTSGADAHEAMEAVGGLVRGGFGEHE